MLGKGHGGLYNASTKEERRKRKAKRRERSEFAKNAKPEKERGERERSLGMRIRRIPLAQSFGISVLEMTLLVMRIRTLVG